MLPGDSYTREVWKNDVNFTAHKAPLIHCSLLASVDDFCRFFELFDGS